MAPHPRITYSLSQQPQLPDRLSLYEESDSSNQNLDVICVRSTTREAGEVCPIKVTIFERDEDNFTISQSIEKIEYKLNEITQSVIEWLKRGDDLSAQISKAFLCREREFRSISNSLKVDSDKIIQKLETDLRILGDSIEIIAQAIRKREDALEVRNQKLLSKDDIRTPVPFIEISELIGTGIKKSNCELKKIIIQ